MPPDGQLFRRRDIEGSVGPLHSVSEKYVGHILCGGQLGDVIDQRMETGARAQPLKERDRKRSGIILVLKEIANAPYPVPNQGF